VSKEVDAFAAAIAFANATPFSNAWECVSTFDIAPKSTIENGED
jgi:hypothetical protein